MRTIDVNGMMPVVNLLYIGAIAAIILLIVFSTIRDDKKFKKKLLDRFGKIPEGRSIEQDSINGFHLFLQQTKPTHEIDSITWNDLEMDKIYARIDACYSSVGEEYLYAALHRPIFDHERLQQREKLILWLDAHTQERYELIRILSILGKQPYNGISTLMDARNISSLITHEKLYFAMSILPFIGLIAAILFKTWIGLMLASCVVFINIILFLKQKLFLESRTVTLRYATSMLLCAKSIANAKQLFDLPVRDEIQSSFAGFRHLVKGMRSSYLSARCSAEFQSIIDAFKIAALFDIVKYNRYVRAIAANAENFQMLFETIGELDTCLCILSYRKSLHRPYCQPTLLEHNALIATSAYHPLLQDPIYNSVDLDRGAIITGSNASGKSTFIKTIALNGIFALTIHTCNAESFCIKPALVMTSMALRDDMQHGESYFMTEIRSLKRMVDSVDQGPCICFIDEILRGTNCEERIAASRAVLEYMARKGCLCIVATHDIVLARTFAATYDTFHFEETVSENGNISFDYTIHPGISEQGNAIAMLEAMDMKSEIVQAAKRHITA